MGRLTKRYDNEIGCELYSCYECCVACNTLDKMLEKLAHYEDMEEQGRLIELPCAVGDTVYVIEEGFKDIDLPSTRYYYIEENPYALYMLYARGDWIFFTKEEAEAKLKELEGK